MMIFKKKTFYILFSKASAFFMPIKISIFQNLIERNDFNFF